MLVSVLMGAEAHIPRLHVTASAIAYFHGQLEGHVARLNPYVTPTHQRRNRLQLLRPPPERRADAAEAALGHAAPQVVAGQQRVLYVEVFEAKGAAGALLRLHLGGILVQHAGQQLVGQQQGGLLGLRRI